MASTNQDQADYADAARAATGIVIEDQEMVGGVALDPEAPLAPVPLMELSKVEAAALGRMMEYTRKGKMKPRQCTRQQWIEDLLTRGFSELETMRFGRSPERVRLTNPNQIDRRGRKAFYEVQSAIEIAYVRRRYRELFTVDADAEASVAPQVRETPAPAIPPETTRRAERAPASGRATGARAAGTPSEVTPPQSGTTFAESYRSEADEVIAIEDVDLAPEPEDGLPRHPENLTQAIVEMIGGTPARAIAFIDRGVSLFSGVAAADQRSVGAVLAVMEGVVGDKYADALWLLYQQKVMKRSEAAQQKRPQGRALRDIIRSVVGEEGWARFLRTRAGRVDVPAPAAKVAGVPVPAMPEPVVPADPNAIDFSYGRGAVLTPFGAKTRVRANIAAIKLLKLLEAEKREATPEEKKILVAFNGWGQHKGLFENHAQEVERQEMVYGKGWLKEAKDQVAVHKARGYSWPHQNEGLVSWMESYGALQAELKPLLTEREWNKSSASILNAHYTSEGICHWMWDLARQAGFAGGDVLEPALGASGRILAAMPSDLRAVSRTEAVEIDDLSARIAAKLFPQTKVHACGFEEAVIAPGKFDLVISNVPFGTQGPGVQEGAVNYNLHNFFIAESMKKLKPGGIAILITSSFSLEANDDQREALNKVAELHGAVRLPSDAFKGSAGTDVTTDVLLLRKPDGTMQASAESFAQLTAIKVSEEQAFEGDDGRKVDTTTVNEYYGRHPELVMGEHSLKGKMYGQKKQGQYTVLSPDNADLIEIRLADALKHLPVNITVADTQGGRRHVADENPDTLMATMEERPGMLVARGDREFYIVQPSRELIRPAWQLSEDLPKGFRKLADVESMAAGYIALRSALERVIAIDLNPITTDAESDQARSVLQKEYRRFAKKHGTLFDTSKQLRAMAPQDSSMGNVLALETVREKPVEPGKRRQYEITTAQILEKRTLFPVTAAVKAETIDQAVFTCLNQLGSLDAAYIAELLGRDDVGEVTEEVLRAGLAFRDHESPDKIIVRSQYLSGDVISKARAARRAATADPRLEASAAALEAVAPEPKPFERINAQFGATWIPPHLFSEFVKAALNVDVKPPMYDQRGGQWFWPGVRDSLGSATAQARMGTDRVPWGEVLMDAMCQNPRKIYDRIGPREASTLVFNPEATAAVRARVEAIGQAWKQWLGKREDVKEEIAREFNSKFNRVVGSATKGDYLTFPGIAKGPGALAPRFYQKDAVARFLEKPAGVVAHGTGYGKTLTGILIAHESKRLGIAKKPLMVCDSANYAQFVAAYRNAYPQDRILVADDVNYSPQERENFKAQACYGNFDCILMSRTQFGKIPVSRQTLETWANNEIGDLRYALEMASMAEDKRSQRKIETALAKATARLADFQNKKAKESDPGLTFEQLGVDQVIVDECHRHKKTGFASAFGHIKGVDTGVSTRGRDLLMKARFIQDRRKGMGVIGLSGTPCTNTMAEFWNMNRLFDPNALTDFNVEYFDSFKTTFCLTETRLEMNEANGKYRYVERMSRFMNATVLSQFVRTGADLQLDPTKLGLKLPGHESGQIEFAITPITDAVLDQMQRLARIYQQFEELTGKAKKDASWVPLTLMGMGMAASIDPRLMDATAPDDPDSLVNACVANVTKIARETAAQRSTQVIFCDRYRTMDTSVLAKLEQAGISDVRIELDETSEGEVADPDDVEAQADKTEKEADELVVGVRFNLYHDIRDKVIASGALKPEEIAIIGEAKNADERGAIFEKVKTGAIRLVIGSSDKLGIGANFQDRLYAAHNFDPPRTMTPDAQEQRDGRIIRSGNTNEKVRVLLYGMQDTCTVAIWNRIQTKRRFIRQGLMGDADELEDVGDVRLDEFKAALVEDKRELKIADLNGRIKDERMAIDVAEQRADQLANRVRHLESCIGFVQQTEQPRVERVSSYLAQHVPSFEKVTADVSRVAAVCQTKAVLDWFAERKKNGKGGIIEGSMDEVEKELTGLVDAMKEAEIQRGREVEPMGTIQINNLPVKIEYAKVTFKSSGRESEALLASIANPLDDKEPFVGRVQFGTAAYLLRSAASVPTRIQQQAIGFTSRIEEYRKDKAAVEAEIATLEAPDRVTLATLTDELAAVQKDMLEHPYVRGSNRTKPAKGSENVAVDVQQPKSAAAAR